MLTWFKKLNKAANLLPTKVTDLEERVNVMEEYFNALFEKGHTTRVIKKKVVRLSENLEPSYIELETQRFPSCEK
jgi:hypothetical protein